MKYGEQLEQESVPEWSLHNVDYNSLKHEIKVHTSRNQAAAIAIPGHQDAALKKFEDSLYRELCRQHDRVHMFVTSKADEISRRLHYLDDQIQRLAVKCAEDNGGRVPLKRQRKFAKYEREVLRCGEDINSLARFTTAQVTAFRKITKKYKKWTRSSTLGSRFRENVLGNPKSFTRRDFSQLRSQYDNILTTLRSTTTSFSEPSSPSSDEHPTPPDAAAAQTDPSARQPPHVEFTPLPPPQAHYWNEYDDGSEAGGDDGGYAIYVNPDEAAFPGLAYVQKALSVPFERVRAIFSPRLLPEGQPLLSSDNGQVGAALGPGYGTYGTSPATTSETDDEYSSSDEFPTAGFATHYAALPSIDEQRVTRYREKVLFRATIGCFAAAFVLLGIAGLLMATGRHKLRAEVDAGATVGAVASLCCASIALGMTMYRRDPLSVWHRVAVGACFVAACVLNGMLMILVVGSSA